MRSLIRGFITWQFVRSFGELQVLTRASYLMLIIVPMLASLWPGIRLIVNRYNEVVTDSTRVLERSAERLRDNTERLRGVVIRLSEQLPELQSEGMVAERVKTALATVDQVADELERKTRSFVEGYPVRTIEEVRLPQSWALAFFASLAVLLGHLIYQIGAPDIVRQYSLRQFVGTRLDEYIRYGTGGELSRATEFINMMGEPRPDHSLFSTEETGLTEPTPIMEDEAKRRNLEIIERGALNEYRYFAQRNIVAIVGATFAYVVGLSLLGWIVEKQVRAVANAAGLVW